MNFLACQVYGLAVYRVLGIKTGQQYLCVSTEPNPSLLGRSSAHTKTLPVLFLVLAYIFMKGGILSDSKIVGFFPVSMFKNNIKKIRLLGAILSFLEKVGIECEDAATSTEFGNVKKLLTDTFVKQMYLTKTKTITEPNNDVR